MEWKPRSLVSSKFNVKLSLYLISHHSMKACEGLEMKLHSFFTSHFHASTTFPLGKAQRYLVSIGQYETQKGFGRFRGGKNIVPLLGIEIHFSRSGNRLLNRPV